MAQNRRKKRGKHAEREREIKRGTVWWMSAMWSFLEYINRWKAVNKCENKTKTNNLITRIGSSDEKNIKFKKRKHLVASQSSILPNDDSSLSTKHVHFFLFSLGKPQFYNLYAFLYWSSRSGFELSVCRVFFFLLLWRLCSTQKPEWMECRLRYSVSSHIFYAGRNCGMNGAQIIATFNTHTDTHTWLVK